MPKATSSNRRSFFQSVTAFLGLPAVAAAQGARPGPGGGQDLKYLPSYARAQNHRSLKQSSYDTTGANRDFWQIEPGAIKEIFNATGAGIISHIWFTIAATSPNHLKEIVLRAYWDGNAKPSVETPIGDFFGLNLNKYVIYESEYLGCSPGRSLNCYFSMPYRKAARLTVTNESDQPIRAFYSNIDYMAVNALPADAMYFHAQYRQAVPNTAAEGEAAKVNPDGKRNYVYTEARGRGHLMGVTLGVHQNKDRWMGEGDDMIFVDDETKPAIVGTGSEDYFLGSWNFGGRTGARAFAHRMYGAQSIENAELVGGQYLCYRWHGDNPVTFSKYLKHTMEHGHGNDRGDDFYSVCYWYQSEPYTNFPALPPAAERIPKPKTPAA